MYVFPEFSKELQASIEEKTGEAELAEAKPTSTKLPAAKKKTQALKEEANQIESVNIAANHEGTKEATPTTTPPEDSTEAVPPTPIEAIFEEDHETYRVIVEITKSDKEEEDVLIQSLKRKMFFKHKAHKSTRRL
ncbi:hypothetical protein J1N35_001113 [Gossypium stocksii]|uniref:Uncharacterized protein n=1 Tax=Gossypium stocksii TaxID=47602 RepID=A0A9D4AJA7_9ROSI|nr:hypothetical protein J1N35_001113 [Gossypium stocksii]